MNRVWRNYMGRGLVEAEDDLRETNPPSNRELLDALAADFVKNKYDVKHLMRHDPELGRVPAVVEAAARRTRPTTGSTRATSSAGCRPK